MWSTATAGYTLAHKEAAYGQRSSPTAPDFPQPRHRARTAAAGRAVALALEGDDHHFLPDQPDSDRNHHLPGRLYAAEPWSARHNDTEYRRQCARAARRRGPAPGGAHQNEHRARSASAGASD